MKKVRVFIVTFVFLISLSKTLAQFKEFNFDLDFRSRTKRKIGCFKSGHPIYATFKVSKGNKKQKGTVLNVLSAPGKDKLNKGPLNIVSSFKFHKAEFKEFAEAYAYMEFSGDWSYREKEGYTGSFYFEDLDLFTHPIKGFPTSNSQLDLNTDKKKLEGKNKGIILATIEVNNQKNYEIVYSPSDGKLLTTIPGLPILDKSYRLDKTLNNASKFGFYSEFSAYDLNGDNRIDLMFRYGFEQYGGYYLLLSTKKSYKIGLLCRWHP